MIQVGLQNNYIIIHDTVSGAVCDAPMDYIFIRKRQFGDTTYDFVYKSGQGIIVTEGISLFNVPIASIGALNTEFTDYDSASFENWYTTNIGISKLGIDGGTP